MFHRVLTIINSRSDVSPVRADVAWSVDVRNLNCLARTVIEAWTAGLFNILQELAQSRLELLNTKLEG